MRHKVTTELRYPSLWRGCVGAWNPGLGPSGLTLRDWSGRGTHGALTGGPSFVVNQGRYAVELDASNDYIDLGSKNLLTSTDRVTLSWWERVTSTAGSYQSRFKLSLDGGTRSLLVFRSNVVGYENISVVGSAIVAYTKSTDVPTVAASVGVWLHWCLVQPITLTDISHAWQFWVNGTKYTAAAGSTAGAFGNSGNRIGLDGLGDDPSNCMIDDVFVHNRALSPNEIRLLASRRGIAYEMAPRRRSSVAVAASTSRRYGVFNPVVLRSSR
jgi:hypothetical protein